MGHEEHIQSTANQTKQLGLCTAPISRELANFELQVYSVTCC
jgi:hypothetical protein